MSSEDVPNQQLIDTFVGVAHGDFDSVQSLLEQYPTLLNKRSAWDESAIEAAAQTGRTDIAVYLLNAGAPLDICTAAMLGWEQDVQRILAEDPKKIHAAGAHGIPLIYFPAIRGDLELASYLLSKGASVNGGEGVSTPLHGAVQFEQPGMVSWLIEHGADPSAKNDVGKTPAELAADTGNPQLTRCFE